MPGITPSSFSALSYLILLIKFLHNRYYYYLNFQLRKGRSDQVTKQVESGFELDYPPLIPF